MRPLLHWLEQQMRLLASRWQQPGQQRQLGLLGLLGWLCWRERLLGPEGWQHPLSGSLRHCCMLLCWRQRWDGLVHHGCRLLWVGLASFLAGGASL